jgi:predicted ribosome quality control (RQC) complex YloA/Tae2 family protein
MKVELDPRKSIHENAAAYYDKSKKMRAKIDSLKKAIEFTKRLVKAEEKKTAEMPEKKIVREKDWFEKFHYFVTQNSFMVLGGKDAKSNEIIVKKHLEASDLYFHADIAGAPSVVLKNGQNAPKEDLEEAARFAASFSSAWKSELGAVDVFCVKPEQVHTAAKSGEYLAKGSFVITGEKTYFKKVTLELAITYIAGKLLIAPVETIRKRSSQYLVLKPARESKGESAKKVLHLLKAMFPGTQIDLDWVQQLLPNGGSKPIKS